MDSTNYSQRARGPSAGGGATNYTITFILLSVLVIILVLAWLFSLGPFSEFGKTSKYVDLGSDKDDGFDDLIVDETIEVTTMRSCYLAAKADAKLGKGSWFDPTRTFRRFIDRTCATIPFRLPNYAHQLTEAWVEQDTFLRALLLEAYRNGYKRNNRYKNLIKIKRQEWDSACRARGWPISGEKQVGEVREARDPFKDFVVDFDTIIARSKSRTDPDVIIRRGPRDQTKLFS